MIGVFAPGDELGNGYKVLEAKRGGRGVVYLASRGQRLGKVALKGVRDELRDDPTACHGIFVEAERALVLPPHDNIVPATGLEFLQSQFFLVMHAVENEDDSPNNLRDLIIYTDRSWEINATTTTRLRHACHEIGHALGLSHPSGTDPTNTCMATDQTMVNYSNHEIKDHINANY